MNNVDPHKSLLRSPDVKVNAKLSQGIGGQKGAATKNCPPASISQAKAGIRFWNVILSYDLENHLAGGTMQCAEILILALRKRFIARVVIDKRGLPLYS
jgi:hypothetical protein